jgi:protein-disulfide isomerase
MLRTLLPASLLLLACQPASSGPKVQSDVKLSTVDPKVEVAKIGDQAITAGEVEEAAKKDLTKLNNDYTRNAYQARRGALESLIVKRLVAAQAKAKGVDEEAFVDGEISARIQKPAEAEVKAFFDKNQDKMRGAPYEMMKPRIEEYLTNQKKSEVGQKYIEELKTKNKVAILLAEPEPDRVQVEAKGPSMGPNDAKVTIVEFSDFQCPFCSRAKETVDKVMTDYKGKVRLVFRDYPLPFHDKATKAAEAGQCANDQKKFWEMHDYMFANQSGLDVDKLKAAAKTKGLDAKKFDECLDTGKFASSVQENLKAGQALGVEGTPHFFINGRVLSGAQPYEKFKEVIDSELQMASK